MSSEKYVFVRCKKCQRDNKVRIDNDKSGHYQCGKCQEYLMFYGTKQNFFSRSWIWAIAISLPLGYLGHSHFPDSNGWTERKASIIQDACIQHYTRKRDITSVEIGPQCECLISELKRYSFDDVQRDGNLYMSKAKRNCNAK